MKKFSKIIKIIFACFFLLLFGLYLLFVNFSAPSSDLAVFENFKELSAKPIITKEFFKEFEFRKISMQEQIDTSKVTFVFIHGAIGSAMDFKKYFANPFLKNNANLISYDRIGYNYNDVHLAQQTIAFETAMLKNLTRKLDPKKTVLVGYSYGGPIALAMKETYKAIVLLAPAVYSKVEPMPFMLNFFTWKATRWLVPHVWKSASLEKIAHVRELQKYESNWSDNASQIISFHGTADGIVPYENSLYLQKTIPKSKFTLISLMDVGHDLVWTNQNVIIESLKKLVD